MNAKQFQNLLRNLNACAEAKKWAAEKSLSDVWTTCECGDWLLWLAARMEGESGWHTRQQIVLAACACAETALKHVPAGEDRPRLAIEVTRRWAAGGAEIAEVRKAYARAASAAAAAATAAAYAAAYDAATAAAYAAAYAAATAAAYATDAATAAAYAAAYDAAYAAAYDAATAAARTKARKEMADIVRQELPMPLSAEAGAK